MSWIGVDLDGTLAQYGGWKGPDTIGDPVPMMKERVMKWLNEGAEVRIFTAEDVVLFVKDVSREWAAALAPVMAGIERAAVQTAVQLTQYSQCIRDAVNTYKPFRRERERYLRRRRQTRATFHGK